MITDQFALDCFFEIDRKPTAVSQTCVFCHKEIIKDDFRVKAQHGTARVGMGCSPTLIYAHARCFLKTWVKVSKVIGLPINVSKKAWHEIIKERKKAKKLSIIQQLKS